MNSYYIKALEKHEYFTKKKYNWFILGFIAGLLWAVIFFYIGYKASHLI